MRFAVVGGDKRSAILCSLLLADGHKISSFGLEQAAMPMEIVRCSCLQSCVYGADCVVLPVPAENGGLVNAPFSPEALSMAELISSLWKGQILCGGKFTPASSFAAVKGKLHVADLMERPQFVMGNAVLTAEGAIGLLLSNSEKSLWESKALICGWGRIAKVLALRLKAMGTETVVAARKIQQRAEAEALGIKALDYTALEGCIGEFDYIINTVPARVISQSMLCCARSDALLLELASAPGGFDKSLGENIGLKIISAPGLPGRCAPYKGALLMRREIYEIINEQEE